MDKLTKDEVILQLANLASGIERTTGDSLKAKALREAISFLDGEVSDQENEARIKTGLRVRRVKQRNATTFMAVEVLTK